MRHPTTNADRRDSVTKTGSRSLRISPRLQEGISGVVTLLLIAAAVFLFGQFMRSVPAGAKQSDDLALKTDLAAAMEKDPSFGQDHIRVNAHNGIVRLSGTVLTPEERGEAVLDATAIPGVRGIVNKIWVLPDINQDQDIQEEVKSTLIDNPLLDIQGLQVESHHGVVTLDGTVAGPLWKQLADRLVRWIPGVNEVIDNTYVSNKTNANLPLA
jgi:osmotically-inducible protein OsmY